MTKAEAEEIVCKYEDLVEGCCTCHTGNPPCSWCVEFPGEKLYIAAMKFLEK